MGPNKPIVFISSSEDEIAFAERLVKDLEFKGIKTWFYKDHVGNFIEKINEALTNSTIFIPIYSNNYFNSGWCKKELSAWNVKQNQRPNKTQSNPQSLAYPIFPILYQECTIPLFHSTDVYITISDENYDEGLEKLIKHILNHKKDNSPLPPSSDIHIHNYKDWKQNEQQNSPYHLSTLGPSDGDFFNNRGIFFKIREEIFEEINNHKTNFITLEGESGSGKSSLVLAGLVPTLSIRGGKWEFAYFELNENPFQELAQALISLTKNNKNSDTDISHEEVKTLSIKLKENPACLINFLKNTQITLGENIRILLIAEQLDSLYTKCAPGIRTQFLSLLKNSFEQNELTQITLITTLDSTKIRNKGNDVDQDYKNFIKKSVKEIPKLDTQTLAELIKKSAKNKKVEFESGLPEKIIDDLGDKKTDLVLLGATLVALWDTLEMHGVKYITKDHYVNSKSRRKADTALGYLAKENFESLKNTDDEEKAKKLFLRMIHHKDIDSGKIITRKISVKSAEYNDLLPKLRIVKTTSNSNRNGIIEIEFFHSQLAENWDNLGKWIDVEKDNIPTARTLENNAREWNARRNWSYLHTGLHLIKDINFYRIHKYLFNDQELVESFLKKSVSFIGVLAFSIAAFIFFLFCIYQINEIKKRTSLGENHLLLYADFNKKDGINYFKESKYVDAKNKFSEALLGEKNDPESLIYLNNAKAAIWQESSGLEPYVIATSVPAGGNMDIALEILRGVAHAQNNLTLKVEEDCIDKISNKYIAGCKSGIKGRPLQIMIINDDNDKETAINIAKYLSYNITKYLNNKEVIAVVGHNASEVSSGTAIEYQKGKLIMVSPTSFALNFEVLDTDFLERKEENYVFSVAYSHEVLMEKIVQQMISDLNQKTPKLLLCYDAISFDQKSFKKSFEKFASEGTIELFGFDPKNKVPNKNSGSNSELTWNSILDKLSDWLNFKIDKVSESCDFSKDLELSSVLDQAISENVNTLFIASHVNRIGDSFALLKKLQANNRYKNLKIFGSPTLYTNKTLSIGKNFASGLTIATTWFPPDSKNAKESEYYDEAKTLWDDPLGIGITWRTATAYDTTNVIIEGLNLANGEKSSRESLQKELSSENFKLNGVTGSIKFFSSCSTEKDESIKCSPGKRMVIEKQDPVTLIKIGEVPPPVEYYGFRRIQ